MEIIKTFCLFIITALAEIIGCYLPYLWLKENKSAWLLLPAAISLAMFAWLLTLHPHAAGRVYAAYGGIFIVSSIIWGAVIDKKKPDKHEIIGAAITLIGALIIFYAPR